MRGGRVAALAAVAAAAVAGVTVAAMHAGPQTCLYAAPHPDLPASLRAQGGFDVALAAGDNRTLEETAQRAAVTVHSDLIGSQPGTPLTIRHTTGTAPDAVIVILRRTVSEAQRPHITALVVFLSDCSGRLYYSQVSDLGSTGPLDFPAVTQAAADSRLGPGSVLIYDTDPLNPTWQAATGNATTPAN